MTRGAPGPVFVDTSAFQALADRNDTYHVIAHEVIQRLAQLRRQTLTTNFIIAETHALVLRRLGRGHARAVLESIYDGRTAIERISPDDEAEARRIISRYRDKSFSFTDATSFAVFERLKLSAVFTFDSDFAQYGLPILQPTT